MENPLKYAWSWANCFCARQTLWENGMKLGAVGAMFQGGTCHLECVQGVSKNISSLPKPLQWKERQKVTPTDRHSALSLLVPDLCSWIGYRCTRFDPVCDVPMCHAIHAVILTFQGWLLERLGASVACTSSWPAWSPAPPFQKLGKTGEAARLWGRCVFMREVCFVGHKHTLLYIHYVYNI